MTSAHDTKIRAIRVWLVVVAALVVATLIVGGATRLTESGLSIVEWKPVTGVLPPLAEAQWTAEFEKYKQIPQYRELNRGMSLSEFKTIFWWEWGHRLLGRVIGAVFLIPFLFLLWRGWIGKSLRWPLFGLFALGTIQGAVGWWMVSSGLTERVSVSQYRLAFHMTLACVIYTAIIWILARLDRGPVADVSLQVRMSAFALVVLVLAQIYLGALVAGLDAGLVYNTWPRIDGALIPSAERLWFETPVWRNFFENALTVQFNHRVLAYLILLFALWHAYGVNRAMPHRPARAYATLFVLLTVIQSMVGIATLLFAVPVMLALTHQAMAILLLTVATIHAARIARADRPTAEFARS